MSKTKDWVKTKDFEFAGWEITLTTDLVANAVAWNIPSGVVTGWQAKQTAWQAAWAPINPSGRGKDSSLVTAKDTKRNEYKTFMRTNYNLYIRFNTAITPEQRTHAGLPQVADVVHTIHGAPTSQCSLTGVPNGIASLFIEGRVPGAKRAALPEDAATFEIRGKLDGTEPTELSDYNLSKYDTKGVIELKSGVDLDPAKDRGKPLYIIGVWRWGSEYGVWSPPIKIYVP